MGIKNVLANQLLQIAVNRTSPKALRERLQEEWQAHLGALPDRQPKLSAAAGFLRSTFHQENEKIRLFFLIHWGAFSSILLMHVFGKIDYQHLLSGWGIVLGIFGTFVIYWEPIATPQNLAYIGDEILYAGSRIKVSGNTIFYITLFAVCGAIQTCAYSFLIVQGSVRPNVHGLPIAVTIASLCIAYSAAPIAVYALAKMQRRQCSRWAKKLEALRVFQEEVRYAEIRRILRLHGYAIVYLAAIAQLPVTLF
jgi:hypothetical protein